MSLTLDGFFLFSSEGEWINDCSEMAREYNTLDQEIWEMVRSLELNFSIVDFFVLCERLRNSVMARVYTMS